MIQKAGTFQNKPWIYEGFDTIAEFLQIVEGRPIANAYKHNMTAQEVRGNSYDRPSWTGAKNYDDARQKFIDGTNAKTELARVYNQTQLTRKRQTVAAPCGGAPIVANALRGIPNAMIDTRRKREPKTVRLVVNMSIRFTTTAAEITAAGKQIIEAAGRLDAAGIQTEILCSADKVLDNRQISSCSIMIKTAGHAFNAARVSFSMSSPAFLRVFQFMHLSSNDRAIYDDGYGSAVSYVLKDKTADYLRTIYGPGIYINLAEVVKYGPGKIDDAIKAWQAGL